MRRAGAAALAWAALHAACAAPGAGVPATAPEDGPALVVEQVAPGSPAAAAGLRAGDTLVAWERGPSPPRAARAAGALRAPFDLALLEVTEAPRGPLTLHGRRGAAPFAVTLRSGLADVPTRAAPGCEPPLEAACGHYAAARAAATNRDWAGAHAAFAAAARAAAELGEEPVAALLEREAGFALGRQARLAESREWHQRALRRREARNAAGLEAASSLQDLGIVAVLLNELDAADAHFERAHAILQGEAPRSHLLASVLGFRGLVAERRGSLAAHERLQERALAILEGVEPGGRSTAATLHNLGDVRRRRGDLVGAEDCYRRSLAIKARLPPDRGLAYTHVSIGHVQRARGDLHGARESYERAVSLLREHGPDATAEAAVRVALGDVALEAGDEAEAGARFESALAAYRNAAPNGPGVTSVLGRLGDLARRRRQYGEAQRLYREALASAEKAAPRGVDAARAWFLLGDLALDEEGPRAAEPLLRKAAALYERAAPGTVDHAEALHRLALSLWRRGRPADAAPVLARATALLDAQKGRVGGSEEAAARFHARYQRLYRDEMELLLALGRPEDAFAALERSRAVALRQTLARRDLELRGPLRADLQARPLSAGDVARSLEEGLTAVSFAVGPALTRVFVLDGSGKVRVVTAAVGEAGLRRDVERLRLLLEAPGPGEEAREGLLSRAEALYLSLLRPLEDDLRRAGTVLVVPDGPLHLLPFATLVGRDETGRRRYLAEWKPHFLAPSLTAYALLRRFPQARGGGLLAVGDPSPPPAGPQLGALPGSRGEVAAVAARFAPPVHAFVGSSATEDRVKAVGPAARVLHFAVHGVVDDVLPMDSGLVLAAAAGGSAEDGFLQAWEVAEQMRLQADLVTLSGCDTALGAAVPGEGMLGLSASFQYAGARAVLASLWKVSDRSTASLMDGFYRRLAAGQPAARALQGARRDLIAGPFEGAHPFHWAAFELTGAPR